jgi:hypothetical protein
VRAYGSQTLPELRQSFVSNEFHIRKLVVEIVAKTALSGRDPNPKPETLARSVP